VFWVISVYFNIRNTLPKSCTFLLGHPVYTHTHIYPNIHTTYTHTHIHTFTHTYSHTYTYTHIYTYTYTHKHTSYIYIYIHAHTYTHNHTPIPLQSKQDVNEDRKSRRPIRLTFVTLSRQARNSLHERQQDKDSVQTAVLVVRARIRLSDCSVG